MHPRAIAKLAGASQDARTINFVCSTGVEDRAHDTVAPTGWRLDSFRKNPVILWGHDYHLPPIGKATDIQISGRGLECTVQFATAEEHGLADTVYRLLQGGFLNAGSVGFRPLKYVYNTDSGGFDFTEQELLEFSVVTVPCNPDALVSAKAAGVDLLPIERSLAAVPAEKSLALRAALDATKKAAEAASNLGRYQRRAKIHETHLRLTTSE